MKSWGWIMGFVCAALSAGVTVGQPGENTGTAAPPSGAPADLTGNMLQQVHTDLRRIQSAKAMWAMENNKEGQDQPTWTDVEPYLKGARPVPPCGGVYVLNSAVASPEVQMSRMSLADLQEYAVQAIKASRALAVPSMSLPPRDHAADKQSAEGPASIVTNIHLRFEFRQSPLEGFPAPYDLFNSCQPQLLDISVPVSWAEKPVAGYRGEFRVYLRLRDEARVVMFGTCFYDASAGKLTLNPFIGYLRPPDSVFLNMPLLGGEPCPPRTVDLCPPTPIVLSGIDRSHAKDAAWCVSPAFGPGLTLRSVNEEDRDGRRWGVAVRVLSHGLLPRFTDLQKADDGREIMGWSYGIEKLLTD